MAKYMWCANHSFTSMEDLNKHLERDEKLMIDILPQLKKAGVEDIIRKVQGDLADLATDQKIRTKLNECYGKVLDELAA